MLNRCGFGVKLSKRRTTQKPLCMDNEVATIVFTALSKLSPIVDYKVFVPKMNKGVTRLGPGQCGQVVMEGEYLGSVSGLCFEDLDQDNRKILNERGINAELDPNCEGLPFIQCTAF